MIRCLATLNNDGARNIMNKNYDVAISCFVSCMKLTRERLREVESTVPPKQQIFHRQNAQTSVLVHDFLAVDAYDLPSSATSSFVVKNVVIVTSCGSEDDYENVVTSLFIRF